MERCRSIYISSGANGWSIADHLQKKLIELYSREFTNPELTVQFESRANNSVFVTREVQLPGAKNPRVI
jgi:hypothetical protein